MSESGLPPGATSYGSGGEVSPPRTPDTPVDVTDMTPTMSSGDTHGDQFAVHGGMTPQYVPPPPVKAPKPSTYGEIFDAMLKSTPTALAFHLMAQPAFPPDPNYNPVYDPQIKGTPWEQQRDLFVTSQSAAESGQIIRDATAELGRNSILSYGRGGITGVVAGMASGLMDPSILIPVGGWVKGGIVIGRAGRLFRAVDTAIGVGLGAAAQEAELQTLMQTRTAGESAIAIGGSVLLGSVLGGVFGKVSPGVAADLSAQIEAHMNGTRALDARVAPDTNVYTAVQLDGKAYHYSDIIDGGEAGKWHNTVVERLVEERLAGLSGDARAKALADLEEKLTNGSAKYGYVVDGKFYGHEGQRTAAGANQAIDAAYAAADKLKTDDAAYVAAESARLSGIGAQIVDLERGTALQRGALGDFTVPKAIPWIGGRKIGVARALAFLTPKGRIQMNEFREARLTGNDLFAGNAIEENYTKGIATSAGGSVEARVGASYGDLITVLENNRSEFSKYRFGKKVPMSPTAAALQKFAGQAKGDLTYPEFQQAITDAWLAGDVHAIPEVEAAAKFARKTGLDPLRDEAIQLKVPGYHEDMKPQSGDAGHVPRSYNQEAVVQQGDGFNELLFTGFKRAQAAAKQKHDDWIASHTADIEQQIKDLEMSGEQRALALAEIGGKLKDLRQGPGKIFAPVDEHLALLRAAHRAAREAGPTTQVAADAGAAVKAAQEKAGSAYADFVSTRNSLMSRMSRISNNIVGRENQAARLRAKIADVEAANVDRLYRMHNKITDLEDRIRAEGPEGKQAELDQLRTDFAKVLERSQAAQDKAAAATAKAREQLAEHPAPAAKPVERIDAAAVRLGDKTYTGLNHADAYEALVQDNGGKEPDFYEHGFTTNTGRFVEPEEALKIANRADQVGAGATDTGLISEDLKPGFASIERYAPTVITHKAGPNPELSMQKRPVINLLKARGGVDPQSTLGAELRHMGVDNKTAPGLFRGGLEGGKGAADNIVASEHDIFRDSYPPGEYVPEADILAAVREEMHGNPIRTADELLQIDNYEAIQQHNAGAKEDMASLKAAATLKRIEAAEAKKLAEMTDLADRIGERENFDAEGATADLRVLIERRLAQSAQVVEDASRYMTDLSEQLKAKNPDLVKAKVAALKQRLSAVADRRGSQLLEMSDQEIRDAATGIRNNITGLGPRMALPSDMVVAGPRGPLKERVLNFVTTEELKPFLEWNSEAILQRYIHTMSTDLNLIRKFGSVDMKDRFAKITDEANAAKVGKPGKEQKRINDKLKSTINDLSAMRDILRGTYALPKNPDGFLHRASVTLRTFNLLTKLGMMTVSSLSDLGKATMVNGQVRSMRTVFVPLWAGLKEFNIARADAKRAGVGTDMVIADQILQFSDIAKAYSSGTMFERGLHKSGQAFGVLTLMNQWNAALKQWVGITTITRALEGIEAMTAGKITAKERGWLAEGGINESLAAKIQEQFKIHGGEVDGGGVRFANTADWNIKEPGVAEARRALHAFINRDVNRTIVTPGIGDKPLMMHGDVGSVVGQFQSFAFASIQHTLVSGLQQKDKAVFASMLLMLGFGALSYKWKSDLAGFDTPDPTTEEGAKVWAAEALDNSGILGILMNADHAVEKMTGDAYGLSALTGKPARRYANVNAWGAFLGPSFGTGSDMLDIFAALATNNVSQSTVHKAVKLTPLQNLAWARWMFQMGESGINNYFGIPQRRQ